MDIYCNQRAYLSTITNVEETEFHSAANGQKFTGIYSFEDKEPHVLNWKSLIVIYMLQCVTCNRRDCPRTQRQNVGSPKNDITG